MRTARRIAIYATALATPTAIVAAPRELTVADAIAAPRILGQIDEKPIALSPDGSRFVAVTIRGDLARNGNWIDIISGSLSSWASVLKTKVAVTLFTKAGDPNPFRQLSSIRWLDSDTIAFRWSDRPGKTTVLSLNLETGRQRLLAEHDGPIGSIAVSDDGRTVAFVAPETFASENAKLAREGFAVSGTALHPLLIGQLNGKTQWNSGVVFISRDGVKHRVFVPGSRTTLGPPRLSLSPDGRWLIVEAPPVDVPASWLRFAGELTQGEPFQDDLRDAVAQPAEPSRITQLWVYDTQSDAIRPLWDAPSNWLASTLAWSPDSKSLLVGPTYLPAAPPSTAGVEGKAFVEVNVATGGIADIPVSVASSINTIHWISPNEFQFIPESHTGGGLVLRRTAGKWLVTAHPPPRPAFKVHWTQQLNDPPKLIAQDLRGKRTAVLIRLNPDLRSQFDLGQVQLFSWTDKQGRGWTGKLFLPPHRLQGRRLPLVIQSHPHQAPATEFSFNGDAEITTAFAARPLAARGFAVLQMDQPETGLSAAMATPQEWDVMLEGYRSAIAALAEKGLIEPSKVGLVGFSRSGEYVSYALTRSAFPIAAAVISDNADAGYLQYLMSPLDIQKEFERTIGAVPIGSGLSQWFARSPGFNVQAINAPIRLERVSGGIPAVIASWEMYSLLRRSGKPVELYVVPEIDNSSHILELPSQILASQQGTVDWMDYWLNGHRDERTTSDAQYSRWYRLRQTEQQQR